MGTYTAAIPQRLLEELRRRPLESEGQELLVGRVRLTDEQTEERGLAAD